MANLELEARPAAASEAGEAGVYIYAIADGAIRLPEALTGIGGTAIYACNQGTLAAIVNTVPNARIRPERRNLAAHQEILRQMMTVETVLPLAFGVIGDDCASVERLLTAHQDAFQEQLRRVSGAVEMSLRVSWDAPNIFAYFIARYPDLLAARDRMLCPEATQDDKFAVGRLFESLLHQEREKHTAQIEQELQGHCREIVTNSPKNETEIANFACLVARSSLPAFEERVEKAASHFNDEVVFSLSGPWAPHHFVEMTISL